MITINVNGVSRQIDIEPDTPLLWVLRDVIGLTGTKFACGIAQCGACTVHINGVAMRSCSVPIGALEGARVVTIEGLSPDNNHQVQRAWIEEGVPQCGYCQSGQIMAVVAFLKNFTKPKIWATTSVRSRAPLHAITKMKFSPTVMMRICWRASVMDLTTIKMTDTARA